MDEFKKVVMRLDSGKKKKFLVALVNLDVTAQGILEALVDTVISYVDSGRSGVGSKLMGIMLERARAKGAEAKRR